MLKILLTLCLAASFGTMEAHNSGVDGDPVIVVISNGNDMFSGGNRGSGIVPISGYADTTGGFVSLYFAQPCGMVQISFSNISDGSHYSTLVNGSGPVVIPLVLSPGSWTVTFTLGDGTVYIGEFTI